MENYGNEVMSENKNFYSFRLRWMLFADPVPLQCTVLFLHLLAFLDKE